MPLCKLLRACARALTRTLPPATTAQRDDGVRRQECPLRALWSPGEKDVRGPSRGAGSEDPSSMSAAAVGALATISTNHAVNREGDTI